jgi:AcrR family transcriptional regulator
MSPSAPAPRDRRTRLSPDDRRAQLIAHGVAALADREFDALTIEELSSRAGVSRTLFSHYFGTRQGFHAAVLQTATEAMLTATAPRPDLSPRARLADTLRRTIEFVRDHGGTFSSFVRGTASGDPAARELVEASRVAQAQRVLDLFAEGGEAPTRSLEIAVRAWVAFVEQTLIDAALGTEVTTNDLVDILVDCLDAIAERTQPGSSRALAR